MAITIGGTEISQVGKITVGGANVQAIYVGDTKVWPSATLLNFVFMSHRSSSTRTINVELYQNSNRFFWEFFSSEFCVNYTEQHNYSFLAGVMINIAFDIGAGKNGSNGLMHLEVVRDDDVVVATSTDELTGAGSKLVNLNFNPVSGRFYRIYATFVEYTCQIQ